MDFFLKDKVIIVGGGTKSIAQGIAQAVVFLLSARSSHISTFR